ncbi:glutathione-specific gamma-glutamylcyclotransferase 1-like [Diadema antillarum]|uniref:glutathione-specific gamma-glutamylcyclotransferase 1-like n=1 Tax=Diadema antillarum TaxID=105358 RepID=UPI003A8361EB
MLAQDSMWIFGYGSLIWHPNFDFTDRKTGYVDGFVTRFWQGSITHRGTPDKPGRVATMIEQQGGQAWGVVFKVEGTEQITKALLHLNTRECHLGGYQVQEVTFTVTDGQKEEEEDGQEISAIAFRATPDNDLFEGPDTAEETAKVVAASRGWVGHNAEYLFRLVDFMHQTVPDAKDRYLFELESLTMQLLKCNCTEDWTVSKSHRGSNKRGVSQASDTVQYYHKCFQQESVQSGAVSQMVN